MTALPRAVEGLDLAEDVPLGPLTTFGVGGPARFLAHVADAGALRAALAFAARARLPVLVLGEGSNVLVADEGFPGLVVRLTDTARAVLREEGGAAGGGEPEDVVVRVGAGLVWDELVAWSVAADLAGIECLSGIPGLVGAAPIQNIGAYGQEVAETVVAVHALDRATRERVTVAAADCGFGYRASRFKEAERGRHVVLALDLRLRRGGRPALRYPELARQVAARTDPADASLVVVRETVLAIRRTKSMVRDPADPNARSAGSFFLNPVVSEAAAAALVGAWAARGGDPAGVPRYAAGPGRAKLSAAWLIEQAGFPKGYARGRAALSERHVLALVNRDGASAAELLALAREVRDGVRRAFGVTLLPEPALVGFDAADTAELRG
jgi:UDP-N-acetylmuramate dehydrogenase